jgi:hypothetical protein
MFGFFIKVYYTYNNSFNTNTIMKNTKQEDLYGLERWRPKYGRYNLDVMLRRLDDISKIDGVDSDNLRKSEEFVRRVFDDYWNRSKTLDKEYGFVFAVPTRICRDTNEYHSEATSFLPIIQDIDSHLAQLLISELPPCVIEEFDNGAILFVPLFSDLLTDYKTRFFLKRKVDSIVNDTAMFISQKLRADIVGLGGILPKITGFGKPLRKRGLRTTTGHGGTVSLIGNIFEHFYLQSPADSTVGIVGCGAIGEATADLLLKKYPDLKIYMHDKRKKYQAMVIKRLQSKYGLGRVSGTASNIDLLTGASIIISAITSRIEIPSQLDLTNKVIIDDSQPGSFSGDQVRSHGGTLVWVVGHDNTKDHIMRRQGNYTFGHRGLAQPGDVWGCEAEVAALWASKRYDLAIEGPVTLEQIEDISKIFDEYGVGIADWQEHGQLVAELRGSTK